MELKEVVIAVTLLAFLVYALRVRSIVWDRVVLILLGGVGIVLALQPELANRLAHAVGVGRGADLLVYVFVLFSLFHIVYLGSRLRRLERQITQQVRASALERGSQPPG
jgi:hypothetical protein